MVKVFYMYLSCPCSGPKVRKIIKNVLSQGSSGRWGGNQPLLPGFAIPWDGAGGIKNTLPRQH